MKKPAKKKKVAPIPKGYSVLTPYLSIQGAAAALEFYKRAFGAKLRMKIAGPNGSIGHAEITIDGAVIMLADEFPGCGTGAPSSLNGTTMSLMLYVKVVDAAFGRALAAGAVQLFAPENKFYGDRSGLLKDPFGHVWCLSTHVEDVSPKEMTKRAKVEMAKMMSGTPPKA